MFIGFSKTIARVGGVRLNMGMRMNKKNAAWFSLLILFIALFKLIWYMLLLCGWLIYAMFYGMYWCIKKIILLCKKNKVSQETHKITKN